MARNQKKSGKSESFIILIIFLVGALGAFSLLSGQDRADSDPSNALVEPAEMAQASSQGVYQ